MRGRLHLAALLAAAAYAGAVAGAYLLVAPTLRSERDAGGVLGASAELVQTPSLSTGAQDLLAMRTLAARAQRGVYVIEGAGGGNGSGFVAWVQPGRNRSYVLTARAVVAGVLADRGRAVYVRRGPRFWPGRIVRVDGDAGLALVRVDTVLQRPLWQERSHQAALERDELAFVVPAGPDTPFGESFAGPVRRGRLTLQTGSEPLNLGAPVLAGNGRLVGVVVATQPSGLNRVVSIERACATIRRCLTRPGRGRAG